MKNIDYQVKQDELLKEQEFLNQYGVHKGALIMETTSDTTNERNEEEYVR